MQTLLKFKEFYDKITATTKSSEKAIILTSYKDDEDIKFYLHFLLNTYITTGISDKKFSRKFTLNSNASNHIHSVKGLLEFVKTNNTGSDKILEVIMDFIVKSLFIYRYSDEALYKDLFILFKAIITKNLPMGIDAKSVNKIIPGLIPTFEVMLANTYFKKPEVINGKEFALTTKIDGGRIIAIKKNNNVKFYTRQGKEYIGLVDLEKELLEKFPDNICLDGELVAIDTDKENTYKNTMKLSGTKDTEKHGLKMLVFDYMTAANFELQNCPVSYATRYAELTSILDLAEPNFFERLKWLYKGNDVKKITEILNEQTDNGEEGIMINILDAPYDFKRSNSLLKVKKFLDTEIKIVGFESGINKYANTLGALTCEYCGGTVGVGSGLSDQLRDEIWNNKDKYIGKIITVKYFEESYDSKTGQKSLRFPIFLRFREDV